MSKRKLIVGCLLIIVSAVAWYGYREYTRGIKNLQYVKPDLELKAEELIGSFESDEKKAAAMYIDKVIAVTGYIRDIEKDDHGNYTVILGKEGSLSSIRCSMDSLNTGIDVLQKKSTIAVKGVCTGFNTDDLVGSDIFLNRCVIDKNKK